MATSQLLLSLVIFSTAAWQALAQYTLSMTPDRESLKVGDDVTITCTISAQKSDLKFKVPVISKLVQGEKVAVRNYELLEPFKDLPRYEAPPLPPPQEEGDMMTVTYSLTIKGIQGEDRGNYICEIQNTPSLGSTEKDVQVAVSLKTPRLMYVDMNGQEQIIKASGQEMSIREGSNGGIRCHVIHEDDTRRPALNIYLQNDDYTGSFEKSENTRSSDSVEFYKLEYDVKLEAKPDFSFNSMNHGDMIRCESSVQTPEEESEDIQAKLNILFAPKVSKGRCEQSIYYTTQDSAKTLDCAVMMNPAPSHYMWTYTHNGESKTLSWNDAGAGYGEVKDEHYTATVTEGPEGEYKFSLAIHNVANMVKDQMFELHVMNSNGEVRHNINLKYATPVSTDPNAGNDNDENQPISSGHQVKVQLGSILTVFFLTLLAVC